LSAQKDQTIENRMPRICLWMLRDGIMQSMIVNVSVNDFNSTFDFRARSRQTAVSFCHETGRCFRIIEGMSFKQSLCIFCNVCSSFPIKRSNDSHISIGTSLFYFLRNFNCRILFVYNVCALSSRLDFFFSKTGRLMQT
jgi:hypothetical protein